MNSTMNTDSDRTCPGCGMPLASHAPGGLCPACLLEQGLATEAVPGGDRPPFHPPSVAEVAPLFPQLELVEWVGKGGMGAVYKARQPGLDRWVALKIVPVQAEDGAKFAERFNREARALARLNHPNIVAVHEFGQVTHPAAPTGGAGEGAPGGAADRASQSSGLGYHYFVMEYVDGANLRQLVRAGRLSPREALAIVPQVCDALQYAHDEGVVHRDIKPENILVDRRGRVKIADFGLAKILAPQTSEARLTVAGQVMGTPHYMAPEQVERPTEVDHRADIYSLGVVFYEMLTGELPLGKFPPPSRKVQVDVRLDDVVLHALEKEPDRRYQQASEVKSDVQGIATSSAPAATPPPTPTTATGPAPPHPGSVSPRPGRLAQMPSVLWLALVTLAVVAVWKAVAGPQAGWSVLAEILLVAGLVYRVKVAYVATLFFAVLGVVVTLLNPPSWALVVVVVLNGLVALPVWLCANWFFPTDTPQGLQQRRLAWTATLLWLPPLTCLWFVLSGHEALNVDLDADAQFYTALLGLPSGTGLGVLLAWAMGTLAADPATPVHGEADSGRRTPWQVFAAWAALAVSLPVGGAFLILVQSVRRDPSWNPGTAEYVVTLLLAGGAILAGLASVALGLSARRRIRGAPDRWGGDARASMAVWTWPVLLAGALLWVPDSEKIRAERQQLAARLAEQTSRTEIALQQAALQETEATATAVGATGSYRISLGNGAVLEAVALCRDPRGAARWFWPDGTLCGEPRFEILELPELVPTRRPQITIVPENEVLCYVRWSLPAGSRIHSQQPTFDPPPSDWELPAKIRDRERNLEAQAELVCFSSVPHTVTYDVASSFGPWSPVSVYSLKTKVARDLVPNALALWSEPRYDTQAGALRYEVMHTLDRRAYALRMIARMADGQTEELVFHTGPQGGSPAKGYALVHGTEAATAQKLSQVLELVLEQTPWVRSQIRGIVLPPLAASAGSSPNPTVPTARAAAGLVEGSPHLRAQGSLARNLGIGAAVPPTLDSPWPLQPEELAIVPDGPMRDSRPWKRPSQP
ncbi:MAG: serine/threonine protein kinase [Verrucomicrobia bacterium]|nr:serine/threonine protein kinase [Verrucomicrobiota bacterium]